MLNYSRARPAILVAGKGRGGMFLFLLFLHFHSCFSFFPVPLFHLLLFYLFSPFLWEKTQNDPWGWSGGAKVSCILCHRGVQLILAYSWARPAIIEVGKGRGGMFLFLLFLPFHSCSSFFPVPLFHLFFYLFSPFLWEKTQNDPWGWSGGAKVSCILCHRGVQLILAYSWARPAIIEVGKGRGGMFLFLLFLPFHSCSSFFPVPLFHLFFYLFSPFLWETTQNDPQGLTCR